MSSNSKMFHFVADFNPKVSICSLQVARAVICLTYKRPICNESLSKVCHLRYCGITYSSIIWIFEINYVTEIGRWISAFVIFEPVTKHSPRSCEPPCSRDKK